MTVTWHWYNDDKTIVIVTLQEGWTWDALFAETRYMEAENIAGHTVSVITDMREGKKFPPDGAKAIRALTDRGDNNYGANVFIGAPLFMRRTIEIAKKVTSRFIAVDIHFADSVDEALSIIKSEQDAD